MRIVFPLLPCPSTLFSFFSSIIKISSRLLDYLTLFSCTVPSARLLSSSNFSPFLREIKPSEIDFRSFLPGQSSTSRPCYRSPTDHDHQSLPIRRSIYWALIALPFQAGPHHTRNFFKTTHHIQDAVLHTRRRSFRHSGNCPQPRSPALPAPPWLQRVFVRR